MPHWAESTILTSVPSELYHGRLLPSVVLKNALFSVISVCGGAKTTAAEGKAALSWDFGRRETEILDFAQAVAL